MVLNNTNTMVQDTIFTIVELSEKHSIGSDLDFEELIIAEKIRQCGFCAYFIPQARIFHKGSVSAGKLRARRYIENAKSEEYFLSRYVRLSPLGRSVVKLIRFLTYTTRALLYRNYRENFLEFMNALRHTTSYS